MIKEVKQMFEKEIQALIVLDDEFTGEVTLNQIKEFLFKQGLKKGEVR